LIILFYSQDDLVALKVTNELHHISIRRGIQILRVHNSNPYTSQYAGLELTTLVVIETDYTFKVEPQTMTHVCQLKI
jgi:hypothetical protein